MRGSAQQPDEMSLGNTLQNYGFCKLPVVWHTTLKTLILEICHFIFSSHLWVWQYFDNLKTLCKHKVMMSTARKSEDSPYQWGWVGCGSGVCGVVSCFTNVLKIYAHCVLIPRSNLQYHQARNCFSHLQPTLVSKSYFAKRDCLERQSRRGGGEAFEVVENGSWCEFVLIYFLAKKKMLRDWIIGLWFSVNSY